MEAPALGSRDEPEVGHLIISQSLAFQLLRNHIVNSMTGKSVKSAV